MITTQQQEFLDYLRQEYNKKYKPWHPAVDARSWRNYLIEEFCMMECRDSMRGNWLDFGTNKAEAKFNLLAEQHQVWKALTE